MRPPLCGSFRENAALSDAGANPTCPWVSGAAIRSRPSRPQRPSREAPYAHANHLGYHALLWTHRLFERCPDCRVVGRLGGARRAPAGRCRASVQRVLLRHVQPAVVPAAANPPSNRRRHVPADAPWAHRLLRGAGHQLRDRDAVRVAPTYGLQRRRALHNAHWYERSDGTGSCQLRGADDDRRAPVGLSARPESRGVSAPRTSRRTRRLSTSRGGSDISALIPPVVSS